MQNIIIILILILIIASAIIYLRKIPKGCKSCVGCPNAGQCRRKQDND